MYHNANGYVVELVEGSTRVVVEGSTNPVAEGSTSLKPRPRLEQELGPQLRPQLQHYFSGTSPAYCFVLLSGG